MLFGELTIKLFYWEVISKFYYDIISYWFTERGFPFISEITLTFAVSFISVLFEVWNDCSIFSYLLKFYASKAY